MRNKRKLSIGYQDFIVPEEMDNEDLLNIASDLAEMVKWSNRKPERVAIEWCVEGEAE